MEMVFQSEDGTSACSFPHKGQACPTRQRLRVPAGYKLHLAQQRNRNNSSKLENLHQKDANGRRYHVSAITNKPT